MKYSANLPKLTYQTSIGSFNITNFFSYYKFNFDATTKQEVELDSKTTLVEAAAKIYNDANSFWLILLANKWLNPFTLFNPNSAIFNAENENKNTTIMVNRTTGTPYYVAPGSIVAPFAATGGNPYDYSYVGNFDLNGDFYLIEDQNFYTKRITVKADPVTKEKSVLTSPGGGTAYKFINNVDAESSYTSVLENSGVSGTISYLNSVELVETSGGIFVEGSQASNASSFVEGLVSEDYSPSHNNTTSTPNPITTEDVIKLLSKKINIFDSTSINQVTRRLVVIKYT